MKGRMVVIDLLLLVFFCSCGVLSNMIAITQENKIYVIRKDWDLKGETMCLPKGCTLTFKGGSISNGTLIGNGTVIRMEKDEVVFNNVILKGSFKAKKFPINAYNSNKLDYFYSFLEAFSGTNLYLTGNYCVSDYLGVSDCTTPQSISIDGRGYKLTLYSFGAYKIKHCRLSNIVIECRNNIDPKNKWKTDKFNFGVVGIFDSSILTFKNVSFSEETSFAYLRGFKSVEILDCREYGSYFFVYDCDNVRFCNNIIENAERGYYSIGRQTEHGQIEILNNTFRNISGGGIILSGGLKYNVKISENLLDHVGGGNAMKSCINIHPRGRILVIDNRVVANIGASSLDIDAASSEYFSEETTVTVKNNVIDVTERDNSLHGMALVGLAKLYFKKNRIKNQCFSFWDTPYLEFTGNTVVFTMEFDKETNIGAMTTHETTEKKEYQHYYKYNEFDIPPSEGTAIFNYQSKALVRIKGKRNRYSRSVGFIDQYDKIEASGDIQLYKYE